MGWESIIFIIAGLFSIAGAAFDWEWFMNNRRAAFFVNLLGRNGARIFYGLLGAALIALAFLMPASEY